MNVIRDFIVFPVGTPRITAGHILRQKQPLFLRRKNGLRVDLIILCLSAQKLFVILDRKQSRGKQHTADGTLQTLLEVRRRVNIEQSQQKASIFIQLCIHNIFLIQQLINLQKMTDFKIEVQNLPPNRAVIVIFEIVFLQGDNRKSACTNALSPPRYTSPAIAFQEKQLTIALIQKLLHARRKCLHSLFQGQEIFFI